MGAAIGSAEGPATGASTTGGAQAIGSEYERSDMTSERMMQGHPAT